MLIWIVGVDVRYRRGVIFSDWVDSLCAIDIDGRTDQSAAEKNREQCCRSHVRPHCPTKGTRKGHTKTQSLAIYTVSTVLQLDIILRHRLACSSLRRNASDVLFKGEALH